jgi:thiol-disulfide isomerase/thioredoxin
MPVQDLQGKQVDPSMLKGKVVILNFWRVDCPPCAIEKGLLEETYKRFNARGLEVLSVNLFDNHEKVRSYVAKHGPAGRLAYDPTGRVTVKSRKLPGGSAHFVVNDQKQAVYEVPGTPTTYVIDRNGMVVGSSAGLINWLEEPFASFLAELLTTADSQRPRGDFNTAAGQGARTSVEKIAIAAADDDPALVSPPAPSTSPRSVKQKAAESDPAVPARTKKKPTAVSEPPDSPSNLPAAEKPKAAKPAKKQTPKAAIPANTDAVPPVSGGSPLPAAMPYTPEEAKPAPRPPAVGNYEADDSGNVLARIPDRRVPTGPGGLVHPSGSYPAQAAAQPAQDPFGGFVLDSFGPAGPAKTPNSAPQAPAGTVTEQVSRDVKELGQGIKDTFSRFFPGRR